MQAHSETRCWVPSVANAFFRMTQRSVHVGMPFTLRRVILEDAKRNPSLRPLIFIGTAYDGKPFVERTTISTRIPYFEEVWQDSAGTALLGLSMAFMGFRAPFTIRTITADPVQKSDSFIPYGFGEGEIGRSLYRLVHFRGRVWIDEKWSTYKATIAVYALEVTNKSAVRWNATGWDLGFGSKVEVGRSRKVIYEV